MRPVDERFDITQGFASLATAGVSGDYNGTQTQVLVALYGNYQPFGHAGTDIGCPVGTPVRAARSGVVIWCDWDVNLPGGPNDWTSRWFFYQRFGGRLLLVQHAPGDIDVYAHLSEFKVGKGQWVSEGDLIALSGDSSGGQDGVLGAHLHTERIVDLSYPTGNGLIYGRIDPTTVWGGIAAQGTITPLEEELVPNEADKVFWPIEGSEKVSLNELLNSIDRKATNTSQRLDVLVDAIGGAVKFTAIDGSTVTLAEQLRSLDNKAELERAENVALRAAVAELTANGGVTPEQIDKAVKEALAGLSITLTAGGK